jgi:DNA-directed RNA polymerase
MKAKAGIGDPDPVIHWTTPSGFLATQGYFEYRVHRIHTKLHGDVKIRVTSETDTPDASRHANGIAPNFVHSMDASHLHLVSAAAAGAGIHSLAMIHDDYGTHAANAQKLYHLIREQFHKMYTEHDPVEDFYRQYPEAGPPPAKGALDLDEVLSSEFFFS